MPRTDLL